MELILALFGFFFCPECAEFDKKIYSFIRYNRKDLKNLNE